MCKILVQNFIIKDILKKKNDVHWISVRIIVHIICLQRFSSIFESTLVEKTAFPTPENQMV